MITFWIYYFALNVLLKFLIILFFLISFFGCAGSLLLLRLFSGCGKRVAVASHCCGFSCGGTQALGHVV